MKRILKWLVPAIAVLVCGLLLLSWKRAPRIKADQVKEVYFTGVTKSEPWSAGDAQTFIDLFNEAQYGGKATGEGGTPEVLVCVLFQNGSYLIVSDFGRIGGPKFEVSLRGEDGKEKVGYYVKREELGLFVIEMLEKYPVQ